MTDSPTTEQVEAVADPVEDADGPKQLREALKHEKAKNAKLTAQAMKHAFDGTGLDPNTGLGKAIAKEFKGEPESAALLAYAKEEYGYEPVEGQSQAAVAVVQGTGQLEQVQATSVSSVPLSDSDALVTAEQEKDYDTAGAIKAQQLREKLKG